MLNHSIKVKHSVALAYLFVLLMWSTTPLAIVFSSGSISPLLSAALRTIIALLLCCVWLWFAHIRIPLQRKAWQLYLVSGVSVFVGMTLSYLAAQSVPSGMISLLFGLAPLISGLIAPRLLGERPFSPVKWLALMLSLVGLAVVMAKQLALNVPLSGLVYVLSATLVFSISSLLIKRLSLNIHPLANTFGSLFVACPLFASSWWFFDGEFNPEQWQTSAVVAVLFLGVCASLLGFLAYFHVLRHLKASSAALGTLITPAIAIALGAVFNNETLSLQVVLGSLIIIVGLAIFQFADPFIIKNIKSFPSRKLLNKSK